MGAVFVLAVGVAWLQAAWETAACAAGSRPYPLETADALLLLRPSPGRRGSALRGAARELPGRRAQQGGAAAGGPGRRGAGGSLGGRTADLHPAARRRGLSALLRPTGDPARTQMRISK